MAGFGISSSEPYCSIGRKDDQNFKWSKDNQSYNVPNSKHEVCASSEEDP
jgi:hypothetical protein